MDKKVSLNDLFFTFSKIGLFTFGGGVAMLPMLEKEVVDNNKWCSLEELMDYYAIGQTTPGIIAVNTATFVGYKHRGIIGGLFATLGVITPSLIIITLISSLINNFSDLAIVKAALKGLGAGVCAILLPSLINIGKKSLTSVLSIILSIVSFCFIWLTDVPVYLIVIFGILCGLVFKGEQR